MAHIDKKKTGGGEGGLGGSLKNSLSKFTQRVSLKASDVKKPPAAQRPQQAFAKVPQPATQAAAQSRPAVAEAPAPAKAPPETAPSPQAAPPSQAAPQAAAPRPQPQAPKTSSPPQNPVSTPEKRIMPAPTPQPSQTPPANTAAPAAAKNQISEDVTIDGKITFPGSLYVNGKIRGEIHSKGQLNLLANSVIEASISVKSVVIEGKVVGNITATESAHLAAGAIVIGDITTAKLSMEPTSKFQGQAKIGNPTEMK